MTEISKEYATALFELALEQKKQAEFAQALEQVQRQFRQNPEYEALLMAPGIPAGQRTGMLAAAFDKLVPEYVLSFLQLLCEKGRMELLDDCITEFNRLFQASQQISVARRSAPCPCGGGSGSGSCRCCGSAPVMRCRRSFWWIRACWAAWWSIWTVASWMGVCAAVCRM